MQILDGREGEDNPWRWGEVWECGGLETRAETEDIIPPGDIWGAEIGEMWQAVLKMIISVGREVWVVCEFCVGVLLCMPCRYNYEKIMYKEKFRNRSLSLL